MVEPTRNLGRSPTPLTFGQKAADWVAKNMGSWTFIIVQSFLMVIWVIVNVAAWIHHWDPYPFILLNLMLSLQAAFTAPIIMMAQNRQAEIDRQMEKDDYETDVEADSEIKQLMLRMDRQDVILKEIFQLLTETK